MVKMYGFIWSIVACAAAAIYVSGSFTMLMAVVFGFICFGMVFMGMMAVLPAVVSHPARVQKMAGPDRAQIATQPTRALRKLQAFKSA